MCCLAIRPRVKLSRMLDIGIIIVNWNTRELLHRCLETVYASEGVTMRVVVVDNGSKDGSADMVASEFPQADLLSGHGNVGYPKGNNLGLRILGYHDDHVDPNAPRYALLLNPDTEVQPDTFAKAVAYMDANPDIGVLGPKLLLLDGNLDLACRRSIPTIEVSFWRMIGFSKLFPKHKRFAQYNLTYLDEDQIVDVGSVVGAYMQMRKESLAKVGLLDETFFMYGEDIDLCKRIGEAGWRVVYYPEITVLHVKRAASRQSKRAKLEFVRAFLIFFNKHYRAETPWWQRIAVLVGIALWGGPKIWAEAFSSPAELVTAESAQ